MGSMKDFLLEWNETPFRDTCPECDGEGYVEFEVPRAHNFNRDVGYLDVDAEVCDTCAGDGKVDRTCVECGYPVTKVRCDEHGHYVINSKDHTLCEECST